MKFGDKIKQLRESREITQKDLAKKIGIVATYLNKIENNKVLYHLSEDKLKKIVNIFNLNERDEKELFELAKKTPPLVKELAMRGPVYQFLRTIPPDWDDKKIEKFIKERHKEPPK